MEWTSTNDDRELDWGQRITDHHPTQADREVALEHLVSLCNLTRAGLWYCVHHRADDDYVRQVARFLKATLPTELPIYLEHSNEVWNGGFPQAKYCQSQGGDFLDYHVRRTAEIARIFRQEKLAVVSVLGLQSVNIGAAEQVLSVGLPAEINATAIAPYFGGEVVSDESRVAAVLKQGVDYVLKQCRLDLDRCRQDIRRHREMTARRGLQLLAYEGGQHLVAGYPFRDNPQLVDLLVAANRHPAMYDLYRDYLTIWAQESRGGLMCLYNSCTDPGIYGSWGLLEYEGQPLEQAHKMRAVLDHIQSSS